MTIGVITMQIVMPPRIIPRRSTDAFGQNQALD
jgi:hypothetical protein